MKKFLPLKFFGKKAMTAIVVVSFLLGYNATQVNYKQCAAQNTITNPESNVSVTGTNCFESVCTPLPSTVVLCVITGMTSGAAGSVWAVLNGGVRTAATGLERFMFANIEGTVEAILFKLHSMELRMINWWESMWTHLLHPAMKSMTTQLDVAMIDQAATIGKFLDARKSVGGGGSGMGAGMGTSGGLNQQMDQLNDRVQMNVDDNACPAATLAGGMGRAFNMGKKMRKGYQDKGSFAGSNTRGQVGALGVGNYIKEKNSIFEQYFCNPASNGGKNNCTGTDPKFNDADTKATEFIYNKLTIPLTDPANGPKYAAATEQIIENTVGSPAADAMNVSAMKTSPGQELWLKRRSFLARYNAVRGVPQIITGWRTPGGGVAMAEWVKELRKGDGAVPMIPDDQLSDNPSYREIMHALSIDRFNSGTYGKNLITTPASVQVEKLTLNTFYLMQLRDYYQLLERTALILAVQVAMLADQVQVQNVAPPTKN